MDRTVKCNRRNEKYYKTSFLFLSEGYKGKKVEGKGKTLRVRGKRINQSSNNFYYYLSVLLIIRPVVCHIASLISLIFSTVESLKLRSWLRDSDEYPFVKRVVAVMTYPKEDGEISGEEKMGKNVLRIMDVFFVNLGGNLKLLTTS